MFMRSKKEENDLSKYIKAGSWKRKDYTMHVNKEGMLTTMEKFIKVPEKAASENSE